MKKKWKQTLLIVFSFGLVLIFAKKIAKKKSKKVNNDLKISYKIDINLSELFLALGGKENVQKLESTLSTLKIELKDINKFDEENFKKIIKNGILKNGNKLTIVCGDNAKTIANEMQKLI